MADSEKKKDNKPSFFKTVSAEWKKIIWPSKESVFRQSVAVTVFGAIVGALVVVFDFFIKYGIDFITK